MRFFQRDPTEMRGKTKRIELGGSSQDLQVAGNPHVYAIYNWLALPVGNEGPSTFTAWYIGDETSLIPY